jgi:pyruvate/2-oxoglutarate dehydrogenase complex dihydrolipoamide acyltransferase (E2) component
MMNERVEIRAPEYHTECTALLSYWYVSVGQAVKTGEDLLDYETDKAVVTLEAPVDGILAEVLVAEDQEIHPSMLLGVIERTG